MPQLVWSVQGQDQVFQIRARHRLGRHPVNDVQLLDPIVSKLHCEIELRDGACYLRDVGSFNGTYVNGQRVFGECRLSHRDQITVGATTFWFAQLDQALAQTPAPHESGLRLAPVAVGSAREGGPASSRRTEAIAIDALRDPRRGAEQGVEGGDDTQRQLDYVAALHRRFIAAVGGLLAATNSEAAFSGALRVAIDVLDADWGAFFELDTAGAARLPAAAMLAGKAALPANVELDSALVGEALKHGRVSHSVRTHEVGYRVYKPRLLVVVPVVARGKARGILWLEREGANEQLPWLEAELTARLAALIAGVITNE